MLLAACGIHDSASRESNQKHYVLSMASELGEQAKNRTFTVQSVGNVTGLNWVLSIPASGLSQVDYFTSQPDSESMFSDKAMLRILKANQPDSEMAVDLPLKSSMCLSATDIEEKFGHVQFWRPSLHSNMVEKLYWIAQGVIVGFEFANDKSICADNIFINGFNRNPIFAGPKK